MLRLFISYRRDDTAGKYLAHMIYRELRRRYGDGSAFLDVDARSPGLSFPKKVKAALDSSDAVLVVIGPDWLNQLKSRQNDPRDWVRYEVSESLKRPNLPVVPVCHGTTPMPPPTELPPELQELAWRDGVKLDPFVDFDAHLARLLTDLDRVVEKSRNTDLPDEPADNAPPARAKDFAEKPSAPESKSAAEPQHTTVNPQSQGNSSKTASQEPARGIYSWFKSESAPVEAESSRRYRSTAGTMHGLGFSKEEVLAYLQSIGATSEAATSAVAAAFGRDT